MKTSTKLAIVFSLISVFVIIMLYASYAMGTSTDPSVNASNLPPDVQQIVPTTPASVQTPPQDMTQIVIGNNGDVSGNTYCAGIGGKPWNNELPVSWNGATCVSTNLPDASCTKAPGQMVGMTVVCKPTGRGWK